MNSTVPSRKLRYLEKAMNIFVKFYRNQTSDGSRTTSVMTVNYWDCLISLSDADRLAKDIIEVLKGEGLTVCGVQRWLSARGDCVVIAQAGHNEQHIGAIRSKDLVRSYIRLNCVKWYTFEHPRLVNLLSKCTTTSCRTVAVSQWDHPHTSRHICLVIAVSKTSNDNTVAQNTAISIYRGMSLD